MRILFDITHPAHVHFFRNPIRMLTNAGHEVRVTSRDKDCTLELLDRFGIPHRCISKQNSGQLSGMASELAARDFALWKFSRKFKPDVLAAIGGIWAAHVGWVLRKPSVIFYDTETAHMQNALTYPFATRIVVPKCYQGKLPEAKSLRYPGYHELSYLHPRYFTPCKETAMKNGLARDGDNFLIRVVSWKASHDIGLKGWSPELLEEVVDYLRPRGHVVISAEGELPARLESQRFAGSPAALHHFIAHCRCCIGESATITSESVVLGVPAVFVAAESRGYIKEQAKRYDMVAVTSNGNAVAVLPALEKLLAVSQPEIARRHRKLMDDIVDVAQMVVDQIMEIGMSA